MEATRPTLIPELGGIIGQERWPRQLKQLLLSTCVLDANSKRIFKCNWFKMPAVIYVNISCYFIKISL